MGRTFERHESRKRARTLSFVAAAPVTFSTSLTRKQAPLGPYRRPMPTVLGGSWGDGRFVRDEVPLKGLGSTLERHKSRNRARTLSFVAVAPSTFIYMYTYIFMFIYI